LSLNHKTQKLICIHEEKEISGGRAMKRWFVSAALLLVTLVGLFSRSSKRVAAQMADRDIFPLQLEEQIPVRGVAGRLDHFSADVKRRRLFVSALGNNSLEVIDTFAGRVIHSIKGLAEPQGPLYVSAVDKLYVANAEDGKVRVYDGATSRCAKPSTLGAIPTT
jgi:DNA-binding beta-propeller fold protein YncE